MSLSLVIVVGGVLVSLSRVWLLTAGDTAGLREQLFEARLPFHRPSSLGGRVRQLFVDRLAPADLLFVAEVNRLDSHFILTVYAVDAIFYPNLTFTLSVP